MSSEAFAALSPFPVRAWSKTVRGRDGKDHTVDVTWRVMPWGLVYHLEVDGVHHGETSTWVHARELAEAYVAEIENA